jgi:hypothetical protein
LFVSAYFLAAELYYESGNMNQSYEYYYAASKEPKLLVTKTGKTAKMMVARLSLGYISPSRSPPIHVAVDSNVTISASEAFDILFTLVTQDDFIFAYQPLGLLIFLLDFFFSNLIDILFHSLVLLEWKRYTDQYDTRLILVQKGS